MRLMPAPGFHFITQRRKGLHRTLRTGGVIPKIWIFYLGFKFAKLKFLVGEVKDAPKAAELIHWQLANGSVNPAWMISEKGINEKH
jgi:hypothetical protein